MNSPAQALLWQLWRRHRWFLLLDAAYLLFAVALVPLLPEILRSLSQDAGSLPDAGVMLATPTNTIFLHIVAMFTIVGGGLKDETFNARTFVLPVKTRTLVLLHILGGWLATCALWLFVVFAILRPTGSDAPLLWPSALLVMMLTVMQAIAWIPLAQAWLRVLIAVVVFMTLLAGVGIAATNTPEARIPPIYAGVFGGITLLAGAIAYRSVAMARRGDAFDLKPWNRIIAWLNVWRKPGEHPFASPARAHLWFECRQFAWQLPLFTGAALLSVVAMPLILEHAPLVPENDIAEVLKQLVIALGMPLMIAWMVGGTIGSRGFTTFLSVRPATSMAYMRSKLTMAAISTLAAWAVVLAMLPLLLLRHGFYDTLANAVNPIGAGKAIAASLLTLGVLVLLTWLHLVENLWTGLTGRAWMITALMFTGVALIVCAVIVGMYVALHREWIPVLRILEPWMLGMLLLVKLFVAQWVLRKRFIPARTVLLMLALWSATVTGLCALGCWIVPSELFSWGSVLPAVLLWVPFSRVAGMPLAMEWNRHR